MAYRGYQLKVGDYIIPYWIIRAETLKITKGEQDLDSYTDSDGITHRFPLVYYVPKAEFETVGMLTNTQVEDFMSNIRRNYIDPIGKTANMEFYIQEIDDYVTRYGYIPSIEFDEYYADENKIIYNQTRIALIGSLGDPVT